MRSLMLPWPSLLLLTSSVALVACSSGSDGGTGIGTVDILGSGDVVVQNLTVTGCTDVVMAGIGALHIVQGTSETLRIETDDNILPHILTELNGSVLQIRTESGFDLMPTRPDYYLTVLDLDGIVFSGAGSADLDGFSTTTLSVIFSGVGEVDLRNLEADDLGVTLSGVGDMIVSGQVDDQTVTVSGVGDYRAAGLASLAADVHLTSIGSATLCVSDSLSVAITGLGSVFYYGDPVLLGDVSVSDRLGVICP